MSGKGDPGAGYVWRRGNVVFSVFVFQNVGDWFDFDAAAREFADAVDDRAESR